METTMKLLYKSLLLTSLITSPLWCMENEESIVNDKIDKDKMEWLQGLKKYAQELRTRYEQQQQENSVHRFQKIAPRPIDLQNPYPKFNTVINTPIKKRTKKKPTLEEMKEQCDICERKLYNKKALDVHRKAAHPEKYVLCMGCKKIYRDQQELSEHSKVCDGVEAQYKNKYLYAKLFKSDDSTFKFRCKHCNEPYKQEKSCSTHETVCSGNLAKHSTNSLQKRFDEYIQKGKMIVRNNAKNSDEVSIDENIQSNKVMVKNNFDPSFITNWINSTTQHNNIEIVEQEDTSLQELIEEQKINDGTVIKECEKLIEEKDEENTEHKDSIRDLKEALKTVKEYRKKIKELETQLKAVQRNINYLTTPYLLRNQISEIFKIVDLDYCLEEQTLLEKEINDLKTEVKNLYDVVIYPIQKELESEYSE